VVMGKRIFFLERVKAGIGWTWRPVSIAPHGGQQQDVGRAQSGGPCHRRRAAAGREWQGEGCMGGVRVSSSSSTEIDR
jgi:hypothetical protein